jgi:hypothetical protein
MSSSRSDELMKQLARPYFREDESIEVVALMSGPAILVGTIRKIPNLILAVGDDRAVLLRRSLFGSKVRKKLWDGPRIRVRYRQGVIRWRLALEDEDWSAFVGLGSSREALRRIARPTD